MKRDQQVRHLFAGDFYPLTDYSVSDGAWIAWQFHRPDLDEGIVQIFRRSATPLAEETFALEALDPNATYAVTNWDVVGGPTVLSGYELRNPGLSFSFPNAPRSAVVVYEKQ